MRRVICSFAAAWLAGSVFASTGSVISSFRLSGYAEPFCNGIYVNASYVTGIFNATAGDYLYRYSKTGSLLNSYKLNGTVTPRGGDSSHIGDGYLSLVDQTLSYLFIFRFAGGNAIASFPVAAPGSGNLQNVIWTGAYYEVNDFQSRGTFNRYTSAGSYVGSVSYNGWPSGASTIGAAAFSRVVNGRSGSYLIASSRSSGEPTCILDMNAGSLITTFAMPSLFAAGGCVGRANPFNAYGDAYWVNWITSTEMRCYQIDIGGKGATHIAPASLGRIKAVFR